MVSLVAFDASVAETRNDPACRRLQQRVIDVFSSPDSRASDDGSSLTDSDGQWLYPRHIRALVTLCSTLDRVEDRNLPDNQNLAGMDIQTLPERNYKLKAPPGFGHPDRTARGAVILGHETTRPSGLLVTFILNMKLCRISVLGNAHMEQRAQILLLKRSLKSAPSRPEPRISQRENSVVCSESTPIQNIVRSEFVQISRPKN